MKESMRTRRICEDLLKQDTLSDGVFIEENETNCFDKRGNVGIASGFK